ncbi:MAG: tetratricopeptide repeat protein [Aquificae bacterium]|nr:tetratricopeptide repeat protein [Aquificota bacterium]
MKKIYALLLGAVIVSCAPVSEKQDRVAELELKLSRVEQKQETLEKDVEKTNERIDKVVELLSEIRLELEKLKLQLSTGTPTVKEKDKEKNLKRVPPPIVRIKPEPVEKPKPVQREEEDAETAYKRAIELYSVKKLYEARDAFLSFIKKFPENKYTDNAFFWIGKIYQELGDTKRAEEIYKSLVSKCENGRLPDCNKLPDAYLQLMKISMDRGDIKQANKYYSILIERFPTSDAAVRAREQKLLMRE